MQLNNENAKFLLSAIKVQSSDVRFNYAMFVKVVENNPNTHYLVTSSRHTLHALRVNGLDVGFYNLVKRKSHYDVTPFKTSLIMPDVVRLITSTSDYAKLTMMYTVYNRESVSISCGHLMLKLGIALNPENLYALSGRSWDVFYDKKEKLLRPVKFVSNERMVLTMPCAEI